MLPQCRRRCADRIRRCAFANRHQGLRVQANEWAFDLLQKCARAEMPILEQVNRQAGYAGRNPCTLQLVHGLIRITGARPSFDACLY